MSKKPNKFSYVFCLFFLLAVLISFIAKFLFPSYADFFLALGLFLVGVVELYAGINQIQKAKAQGEFIFWWKHYVIVSALSFISWAGLFFAAGLPDQVNDVLRGILALFFLLLSVGLFGYAAILTWQQIEMDKRRRQELGVQRIPKSRPMPKDE